jgi:hypothetical protein
MPRDTRTRVFVTLCILLAGAVIGYIAWRRGSSSRVPASEHRPSVDAATLTRLRRQPHVLFRNTDLGPENGRVFLSLRASAREEKYATPLSCERVDFSGGHGVCLIADRGLHTTYRATVFGRDFEELHQLPLPGIPSRVRLSPSGHLAGITVFVSGDSYASGSFSTRATIVETATGKVLGDLEQFAVTRDGQPFTAVDFNFWGITFADDGRLFATLQTGGRRYLIEADVPARSARVVADDIECPSLSPDGKRVAFKKREVAGGRLVWKLAVQDLSTRVVTVLSEQHSVDDQPEWLDDARIVYGIPSESRPGSTDVWVVPADGSGTPSLYLDSAWSPSAVMPASPPALP